VVRLLAKAAFLRYGPSVRSGFRLSLRFQIACFLSAVPLRDLDIGIMSRTFIDKSSSPQIDAPARVMGCADSRYEQEIVASIVTKKVATLMPPAVEAASAPINIGSIMTSAASSDSAPPTTSMAITARTNREPSDFGPLNAISRTTLRKNSVSPGPGLGL